MSSTNNSNTPVEQTGCSDPVRGTSLPPPVSTPSAPVARRLSLEAVNENKTTGKKRSFEETDTVVEEQERHGPVVAYSAMTARENAKRAKKDPSVVEMIDLLHEHASYSSEMNMDDLQQAYDRIVNEQQCTEECENDPVEIPTSSASSSLPHVDLFYQLAMNERKVISERHVKLIDIVETSDTIISHLKEELVLYERMKAKTDEELRTISAAKEKKILKMKNDLVEATQIKQEFWAGYVNEQVEKFQKPLLAKIEEQEAELANTTRALNMFY